MDAIAIIELIAKIIKTAVDLTPAIVKTVEDAKPFAEVIVKAFKKEKLTDAEIATIESEIDRLSNELQKPLPPEEDGPNGEWR